MAAANGRTRLKLGIATLAMFGFGFALVPFYYKICEVTGINAGAEQALAKNTQIDTSRWVTIEFDANINEALPWRFKPEVRSLKVHPGQLVQVVYDVSNVSDRPVVGQAVPSYGPQRAGAWFRKIECFCFTPQTLAAGETRRMPVLFTLDPEMEREVQTLTLSYTFFDIGAQASAAGAKGG